MKHWNRRKPIKVLCFILTVPLLAAILLGIAGITYLWQGDFYYRQKQELQQEEIERLFFQDSWKMMRYHTIETDEGITVNLSTSFSSQRFNLRFQVLDWTGKLICSNVPEDEPVSTTPMIRCYAVGVDDGFYWSDYLGQDPQNLQEGQYAVYGWVASDLPVWDHYRLSLTVIELGYALRYSIYGIVAACLALLIFCFVNLTVTAGRLPGTQQLQPGKWDKCPTDVLLISAIGIGLFWTNLIVDLTWNISDIFANILMWLSIVAGLYCLLGLWLCLVSRIKRKQLLKNTLVYKVCTFLWRGGKTVVNSLPMIWRTALIAGGIMLWSFLIIVEILQRFSAISNRAGLAIIMILIQAVAVSLLLLWVAIQLRRLQSAGKALASGDLQHHVDTSHLVGDLKDHGENLNSIAQGMSKAVDERMKSQRMKTELITNVSHDIKNPLTSIINYSELIAQESCTNPNHGEYAQVLLRKSQHLKRLLDDLVEVSKATTGNLDMDLVPCQAGVLLSQLSGEFADRCEKAGLSLLTRQPEEALTILADSRRIWRVFENLMSNACKYSLPGSRVYLSLERRNDSAVFTFRNTSREPLDISPEELIERFVRGDSARSTEGNGLGLSIAQSLTELQGGEMNLGIDGDLFKVTLAFPLVK